VQAFTADIIDAARSLAKQRRFLAVASLTLALGIGTVTAVFSVVNGVLLRPLPYPEPDRLVNVWSTAPGLDYDRFPLSPDLFLFFRRHNTVFEDMALHQRTRANLTDAGTPEVVDAATTTHSYFSTIGVAFARGRSYTEREDRHDGPRVAVVSHRLWTRRFGGDPSLLGRAIRLNGEPTEVIGIAPDVLDAPGSPDVWLPARFNPDNPPVGNFGWPAIGRLRPGVRPDQAATHLEPLVTRAMREYIQSDNYRAFLTNGRYRPMVHLMKEDIIGDVREPLWILLGTVGMVLLIACGNVANLCLVRAEARQREMAIRAALGSSRAALVRRQLVEALLLSALGTVLGVAVAAAALPALLRLAPDTIPRLDQVRVDAWVLLFAAGAAMLSALLFGLVPAIRYTRPAILAALRHGGRSATDHPGRQRGRQVLVVVQTAMALVLLVGSGLMARSFARLIAIDPGFVPDNVLTFRVALPATAYPKPPDAARFTEQLVARLRELPGVETAGAATELPVANSTSGTAFEIEGRPLDPGTLPPIIHFSTVTPGYFESLRIASVRGDDFTSGDSREGVRAIIVNRAAAERYWPGEDAVGKRLRAAGAATADERPWYVVKGVVADVRHEGLREPPRPLIYFPINASTERAPRAFNYVLRGPGAEAQADAVRRAVWALDPDLPVASVRTMDDVLERSVVQFTFTLLTLAIAAGIALLLGAIGLYGVLSYAVSLRTREIGLRMALGAPPGRVQASVIRNAAVMTGIGLLVGTLAAAWLSRFLEGQLYETRALDLPTFGAMGALLFAVGLLAAYLPARRAAAVSPLEAMSTE
jgi:predicted permease